jgi:hypothetical protein
MRGEEVVGTVRVGNDPASARDGWKAVCEQRRAPFMGASAGAR